MKVNGIFNTGHFCTSIRRYLMSKYILALLLSLSLSFSHAATYNVLSGSMSLSNDTPILISGGGSFTEFAFDGSASSCCMGVNDSSATQSGLMDFDVFTSPAITYFSQTGVDGGMHSGPSIDLVNMTADMTSFYVTWNGTEIYQGNTASVIGLGNGIYELSWMSMTNGIKNSLITEWTMNVSAVPVPPTVFLFLSGLLGMLGLMRQNNIYKD